MSFVFDREELSELFRDFYVLSGMRIVLFDENGSEVLSYPENGTPFCSCMRRDEAFDACCRDSDRAAFDRCRETGALSVSRCHAGLIEVTAPLTDGERMIGSIMFGQITDRKNKREFSAQLQEYCGRYRGAAVTEESIVRIKYKSEKQILAAAKILDACTGYILFKEMITPPRIRFFTELDTYVSEHLQEELTLERLCRVFHISRTRLYEITKPYVEGGIATYIRKKRLTKAHRLLLSGEESIAEIAYQCGFSDYNYFLKVFKKEYGSSPYHYRKEKSGR